MAKAEGKKLGWTAQGGLLEGGLTKQRRKCEELSSRPSRLLISELNSRSRMENAEIGISGVKAPADFRGFGRATCAYELASESMRGRN